MHTTMLVGPAQRVWHLTLNHDHHPNAHNRKSAHIYDEFMMNVATNRVIEDRL
jgi:hypothetical protein